MSDPTTQSDSTKPKGNGDPRSNPSGQSGASGLSSITLSGKGGAKPDGRQTFAADELAIVLSHYEIGIIEKIREFPRGSRRAPKLLIKAERGPFLLKRRAMGKDDPQKVAFCHGIQLHLASRQFPLPHLIGTKGDNNSMLRLGELTYELFEYIQGTPYDQSLEATQDAGKALALMHKLLLDYESDHEPTSSSYHNAKSVYGACRAIPTTLAKTNPTQTSEQAVANDKLVRTLQGYYDDAVTRAESAGMLDWPRQIVHSDWHPGNMLFRGQRVVAVIDYDTARKHQRVIDVANGALQFSILGGGEDPLTWPEGIDLARFKRFMMGYDSVPDAVMTRAELRVVPWLMIQALIAESVIPIARTGMFSRMQGGVFLEMVRRKCAWLVEQSGKLIEMLDD
ncbi:MAG: phosphotransferase enzyme family protein [Phycisphaeraceae bacterium]